MTSFFATIPQVGARSRGHHIGGPFLLSLLPALKHLEYATASLTLHYRLIISADWHIGSALFTSPTWHLNWRHPAPETKYNPPSSKLHATRITCPQTASRGQRIFSIICAFKKKKTVPAEGWQHGHSTESKNCVFVFTSVISRVGRRKKKRHERGYVTDRRMRKALPARMVLGER